MQDDDEDGGEAYDLAKMSKENGEEEEADPVKVHEIKFDEFGIMDDGLDDATADQLKGAEGKYKITQIAWQTAFLVNQNVRNYRDLTICKEKYREINFSLINETNFHEIFLKYVQGFRFSHAIFS